MPCGYKQVLGVDCLACGGQRSVLLLAKGKIWESIQMFPALLPLVATGIFYFIHKPTARIMLWSCLAIAVVGYILKIVFAHGA